MKKYLLPETGEFYKANLHCHSTVSDGKWTPERIKEEYTKRGYSVIAYTDHNVLIDHQDLTDDNFVALNGVEIDFASAKSETEERKCCHVCMVALKPDNLNQVWYHREKYVGGNAATYRPMLKVDESIPDKERAYTPECINEAMKTGRDSGFFVTYNHPSWSFEYFPEYTSYRNMHAMEIVNYGCFNAGYNDYAPQVYDEMLRNGCGKIYCIATDDNHNGAPATSMYCDSFGGFTMIKADKLDYESITDALVKGTFYASQGPKIYSLVYEDGKIKIETSDAESIFFTTGMRRVKVFQGKVMGETVNKGEYEVNPLDKYVRVTVVDKFGKHACTNAYFVEDLMKE